MLVPGEGFEPRPSDYKSVGGLRRSVTGRWHFAGPIGPSTVIEPGPTLASSASPDGTMGQAAMSDLDAALADSLRRVGPLKRMAN